MPRLPKKPAKPAPAKKPAAPAKGRAATPRPAKPPLKSALADAKPAAAKPADAKPAATKAASTKPKRTIPVHALADERIHLAPAQLGRLRQGYLKTLCGLQAVSELSPFALADKKQERCRTCFRKVDTDGSFRG